MNGKLVEFCSLTKIQSKKDKHIHSVIMYDSIKINPVAVFSVLLSRVFPIPCFHAKFRNELIIQSNHSLYNKANYANIL